MWGEKADRRAPRTEKGRGTRTTGGARRVGVTPYFATVPTSTPANRPVRLHRLADEPDRGATL